MQRETMGMKSAKLFLVKRKRIIFFKIVSSMLRVIQGGAKRTHVFQIIVTVFIFNIKKLC